MRIMIFVIYSPPLMKQYEGSYTDNLYPFGSGQTRDEFYEYHDKCRKTPGVGYVYNLYIFII